MNDEAFLREAISLAVESVETGGGPFGALIVRDGAVIARAANRVVPDGDPTAHAEVLAIRQATQSLGTHVLDGCTLYASCQPCPMCYGAIHWARVERIVYAAHGRDAADAGFDDDLLRREMERAEASRSIEILALRVDEALAPFEAWGATGDRRPY